MDGQQDGTDVCPLRGDERRMCSAPSETQSGNGSAELGVRQRLGWVLLVWDRWQNVMKCDLDT